MKHIAIGGKKANHEDDKIKKFPMEDHLMIKDEDFSFDKIIKISAKKSLSIIGCIFNSSLDVTIWDKHTYVIIDSCIFNTGDYKHAISINRRFMSGIERNKFKKKGSK